MSVANYAEWRRIPLGRTKWARLKKTFSTEQNSSFHSSASPRRSNRQWNVNQTDVVGTRVLHDGRQPWLGGRCCSRNWCLAVFAPEMGQVLPNLTPGAPSLPVAHWSHHDGRLLAGGRMCDYLQDSSPPINRATSSSGPNSRNNQNIWFSSI